MDETKKPYVKPEITEMEVNLEPMLSGSGYYTGDDGDGYDGWYD